MVDSPKAAHTPQKPPHQDPLREPPYSGIQQAGEFLQVDLAPVLTLPKVVTNKYTKQDFKAMQKVL